MLATETGLFEPSERHGWIDKVMTVHPHRAGAKLGHQTMHRTDIARPDARGETVGRVVCQPRNLIDVIESLGNQHRTKDLLANDLHVGPYVREHRRRNIVARAFWRGSARHDLRALLPA